VNKVIGIIFLFLGIGMNILHLNKQITGFVINETMLYSAHFYLGFLLILGGIILILTSRTYLDAIIVPTEASTSRIRNKARVASEAYKDRHARVIVASGGAMPYMGPKYKHEAHVVYEELRKAGILPGEIRVDGTSRDNLENILHSLKKLEGKGAKDIGIVSYPAHLDRFDKIINKAKKEGIISKEVHFHRIETDQTLTETLWEIPARILTNYQLRKGIRSAKTNVGSAKKALYWVVRHFAD
jgi:hypothetical protein